MCLGENESELLIATDEGFVFRRCIDGTDCDPDTRNTTMLSPQVFDEDVVASSLWGIGKLDDTYLILDISSWMIYECPLGSEGINLSYCQVFADRPGGTAWYPRDLLVDPIKRLVYVVDEDKSDVFLIDFEKNFLGPLASSRGALIKPTAMSQRPGLYAPLSPSSPPSSPPTAGERIKSSLVMVDAYNSTGPDSHPTSVHDLALEVSATGFIPGTDIPATIEGEIMWVRKRTAPCVWRDLTLLAQVRPLLPRPRVPDGVRRHPVRRRLEPARDSGHAPDGELPQLPPPHHGGPRRHRPRLLRRRLPQRQVHHRGLLLRGHHRALRRVR
jgi:hypothetical protein